MLRLSFRYRSIIASVGAAFEFSHGLLNFCNTAASGNAHPSSAAMSRAKTLARYYADQALRMAGIADRAARRIGDLLAGDQRRWKEPILHSGPGPRSRRQSTGLPALEWCNKGSSIEFITSSRRGE